jgi:hypothetical protein
MPRIWTVAFLLCCIPLMGCGGKSSVLNPITSQPCAEQVQNFKTGEEVKNEVGGVWRTSQEVMNNITGPTEIRVEGRLFDNTKEVRIHHIILTIEPKPGDEWRKVQIVCTSEVTGEYVFTLDPSKFRVPANGQFKLSFDSYATTGNYNKAPHGVRIATYKP